MILYLHVHHRRAIKYQNRLKLKTLCNTGQMLIVYRVCGYYQGCNKWQWKRHDPANSSLLGHQSVAWVDRTNGQYKLAR